MKRIITTLSVFAFVLAFSGSAFAQSTPVNASVDIVTALTSSNVSDLSFGQIDNSQTADAVVDPNGTNSGVGGTASVGEVSITATTGSSISVSFSSLASLSDGGSPANLIDFAPNYTGNETESASGSSDLNASGTNNIDLTGSNYYVFLGGTLSGNSGNAINGATAGSYTGQVTVTISYQ